MILLCLSFCISLLTGFFLASIFWSWREKSYIHLLLRLCLAVGLGFGVSSSQYFVNLLFGPSRIGLAVVETVLLVSLLFLYLSRTSTILKITNFCEKPATNFPFRKILLAGFSCTLTLALLTFLLRSLILPYGGWDAWQTWNFFARFLFRAGDRWQDSFSPLLSLHHPDYPLLIPASVARCWQYIGKETQVAPVITAGLFTFATIGLLFSSLSLLKDRSQALLGGILLAGTPNYVILGSMQFADVPLGFFFLSALALCTFQDRVPENRSISLLAGIMAGFSCWTKNEGFLFLLSIIVAHIAYTTAVKTRKGQFKAFLGGAAPTLALVLFFKWYTPANELISRQGLHQTLYRLTDASRYWLITKSFCLTILDKFPVMLLMAFYLFYFKISFKGNGKRTFIILPLTLCLMFAGYFIIYVITPYDLDWHLSTSFSRLLMQLWPSIIFAFCLMARTPEEIMAEA